MERGTSRKMIMQHNQPIKTETPSNYALSKRPLHLNLIPENPGNFVKHLTHKLLLPILTWC